MSTVSAVGRPTTNPSCFRASTKHSPACLVELSPDKTKLVAKVILSPEESADAKLKVRVDRKKLPTLFAQNFSSFNITSVKKAQDGTYTVSLNFSGIVGNGGAVPVASTSSSTSSSVPAPVTAASSQKDVTLSLFPRQRFDLLSVRNAKDLALAIQRNSEPLFKDILVKMVNLFLNDSQPDSATVTEIVNIFDAIEFEYKKAIINKLLKQVKEDILLNNDYLCALTEIFKSLQCAHFQRIIDAVKKGATPSVEDPLCQLYANDFVASMEVLKKKLNSTTLGESKADNSKVLIVQLETFIALLELMQIAEVKKIEREKYHEKFYEAVDRFSFDKNLKVAFLAEAGKQLFRLVSNDEAKWHSVLRHIVLATQGLAYIAEAVNSKSQFPLNEGIGKLGEALTFQDLEWSWFVNLSTIRQLIFGSGVSNLTNFRASFIQALESEKGEEYAKNWDTHHPFFLRGLVDILWQVIIYHGGGEPEAGKAAILFLERICADNFDSSSKGIFKVHMNFSHKVRHKWRVAKKFVKTGYLSRLKIKYSDQLRSEILSLLKECKEKHFSLAMRDVATLSLERLQQRATVPFSLTALDNPNFFLNLKGEAGQLFNLSINDRFPWRSGLIELQNKLKNDLQLQYDRDFYLQSVAKESLYQQPPYRKVAEIIDEFIQNPGQKVLLVQAPMGYGKSISLKLYAERLWSHYSHSGNSRIPVFGLLPSVGELTKVMDTILEKSGLADYQADLKERPVACLWDALDEVRTAHIPSLYSENGLFGWKDAKLIVTCRTGELKDKTVLYPAPDRPTEFKEIWIESFKERTEEYFEHYLDVRRRQNYHLIWQTAAEYTQHLRSCKIEKEVEEIPLFLKIIADTFPHIVKRNSKKKTNEVSRLDLLDAFFCFIVQRELRKFSIRYSGSSVASPSKRQILEHHRDIAKALQAYSWKKEPDSKRKGDEKFQFPFSLSEAEDKGLPLDKPICDIIEGSDLKKTFLDLFGEDNLNFQWVRRCGLVVKNQGKWSFVHNQFYDYFVTMDILGRKGEVLTRLENDEYELEEYFREVYKRVVVY